MHWLGAYSTYALYSAHTVHMLCIVDTSLTVLMTMRMCLRELYCLFGIFYCLDLNHLESMILIMTVFGDG